MPKSLHGLIIAAVILSLAVPQCLASSSTDLKYFVFTQKCYQSLIQNFNFRDVECIKFSISKLVGYLLVIGGAIIKVPQLVKILLDKSVYGISFTSVLAQSMTNWVTIVYSWHRGNPFSIYGQNAFILVQNIVIMLLFVAYARNVPKGIADPGKYVTNRSIITLIFFGVIMFLTKNPFSWPQILIDYCMVLQISLFSFARITQIIHIFRCKSTGSLALVTCILTVLGNVGRVFTVFVQIKDDYMFAISVTLATILNSIILTQFFVYWKNTVNQRKKHKSQ